MKKRDQALPQLRNSVCQRDETAGIKQQETDGSIVGTSVAIRTENCQGGHSLTRLNEDRAARGAARFYCQLRGYAVELASSSRVQEGGRDSESSPFLVRLSCLSAQSERQAAGRHEPGRMNAMLSFLTPRQRDNQTPVF